MLNIELWEQKKKELKLTFDQLSEVSGIPKRTILGIFRKEVKTPRIDTVQAIEKALGLSATTPQWTAENYANGVTDTKKISITADEEDMLILFRAIGEKYGVDGQEKFKQMGKTILEIQKKSD